MGGLAGYVGPATEDRVASMLGAIAHRGDHDEVLQLPGATFGLRAWRGRETAAITRGEPSVVFVGRSLPALQPSEVLQRIVAEGDADLDGDFALAAWSERTSTLTLARDPFGKRSIYYAVVGDELWFATELKQLVSVREVPVALDLAAVHKYLTFSFVPGDATPIASVRRLLPGHVLTFREGRVETRPWFSLEERIVELEAGAAAKALWRLGRDAVARRLDAHGAKVGIYLSGGIDSSAVGLWLKDRGADAAAFTLDFGAASVEREEAAAVARHLGFPLTVVPVDAAEIAKNLGAILWKLDMPFGDPVTAPHWLLGRAARAAGLDTVWNGEGGDQLFGGWTSKPMIAAAVYGDSHGDAEESTPEQQYLKSYHKFYGVEHELYAPALAERATVGERRGVIQRFLAGDRAQTFLNRVRLTDLSLKGSQNILPRAERMAAAHGLDAQMPLFDRRLAEWSFTLPPTLKLHGACEKYVFKLALQNRLPEAIVWRRKFGMSAPVTDWMLGAMKPIVDDLLSDDAVTRRGLFNVAFVRELREGRDVASETRRRRLGERLWTLMVLEAWCRRFIDRSESL